MKVREDLIKDARQALIDAKIVNKDGVYPKEFGGYISSLGAAIVQSGLLPAMIFYENDSEQASDRKKVVVALVNILNKDSQKYNINKSIAQFLLDNFDNQNFDGYRFLQKVTEAAVAMKLALRMYRKNKEKEGGQDE